MHQIATLPGLDTTNDSQITVLVRQPLQQAGVSNDKILSITGHKNEQSLRDYTDVDIEDHAKLSGILVGASKSIQKRSSLKDTSNEVKIGHGTSVQNAHACVAVSECH